MGYRRAYIRIPVTGKVVLSSRNDRSIHSRITNISQGGLGITGWPITLNSKQYFVNVTTGNGRKISLMGLVVHHNNRTTGLKIVAIDRKNLETIHQLIEEFQTSEEFIRQINDKNIITDWFVDENGDELDFNFELPH